jgi:hypothetical protein
MLPYSTDEKRSWRSACSIRQQFGKQTLDTGAWRVFMRLPVVQVCASRNFSNDNKEKTDKSINGKYLG